MITPCAFTLEDSGLQAMVADFFTEGYDEMFKAAMDKAYALDIYGQKEANANYDIVADMNILLLILVMMHYDRENDEKKGISRQNSYYRTKYNVECFRRKFTCLGYSIKPLLEIFFFE